MCFGSLNSDRISFTFTCHVKWLFYNVRGCIDNWIPTEMRRYFYIVKSTENRKFEKLIGSLNLFSDFHIVDCPPNAVFVNVFAETLRNWTTDPLAREHWVDAFATSLPERRAFNIYRCSYLYTNDNNKIRSIKTKTSALSFIDTRVKL